MMAFGWELLSSWKVNLLLVLIIVIAIWKTFSKRIFAPILSLCSNEGMGFYRPMRKKCLERLTTSNGKNLSILDVGVGDGANLSLFPKDAQVTVLDNNPHIEKAYNKNKNKNPHLHYKKFIVESAEHMKSIADGSMDVVVVTLLLCSVPNPNKVLQEINRVLKKGGTYYFYEHVADRPGTLRRVVQKLVDLIGLHALIFEGCCVSRDTALEINAVFPSNTAKFVYFSYDFTNFPFQSFLTLYERAAIIGEAVKE